MKNWRDSNIQPIILFLNCKLCYWGWLIKFQVLNFNNLTPALNITLFYISCLLITEKWNYPVVNVKFEFWYPFYRSSICMCLVFSVSMQIGVVYGKLPIARYFVTSPVGCCPHRDRHTYTRKSQVVATDVADILCATSCPQHDCHFYFSTMWLLLWHVQHPSLPLSPFQNMWKNRKTKKLKRKIRDERKMASVAHTHKHGIIYV